MVRIDRGFVGVLLIAVVISTMIMGFVSVEKASVGIEIIKNKYPQRIRTSVQERHSFVFNVIARRPYQRVELKFSCLRKMDPVFSNPNITKEKDASLDEILSEVTPVKTCLAAARTSPLGFEREELEVNVNGTKFKALLYDFGLVIAAGQSLPDLSFAPTSYLIWRDSEGNLTYYQGTSDFFLNRNETIQSLVISLNANETTYRSEKESAGPSDVPTVGSAPKLGIVKFDDVEKDDRMYVMFDVDSLSVPSHKGMLELMRVYGDGELVTYAADLIYP